MIRERVTRKAFPGTTRKGSQVVFHALNHGPYENVLLFFPCVPVSPLILQRPVEQNWWKKQLSKVSPCKEHPFANTYQVSAAILPSHCKILQSDFCQVRCWVEVTVRGHPSCHTAHLQTMHASSLLPAFSSQEQLLTLPCSAALREAGQMPDKFSAPCNLPRCRWQQWKLKPKAGERTNTASSKGRQSCCCYTMVGGESLSHHPPFLQTPPHLLSKVLVDFKESRGDQSFLHPTRQISQNIRFSRSDLI